MEENKQPEQGSTLYVKNMVCDRCKMVVRQILERRKLTPLSVELGEVKLVEPVDENLRNNLKTDLEAVGFELIDDQRHKTVEQIKTHIIDLVHNKDGHSDVNLSDYLADKMAGDYSALSKLFSVETGITIERYFILQRIERVKELLYYDDLSLTQIALRLNYSSVAYLSNQFKQITGMTPSHFKTLQKQQGSGWGEGRNLANLSEREGVE